MPKTETIVNSPGNGKEPIGGIRVDYNTVVPIALAVVLIIVLEIWNFPEVNRDLLRSCRNRWFRSFQKWLSRRQFEYEFKLKRIFPATHTDTQTAINSQLREEKIAFFQLREDSLHVMHTLPLDKKKLFTATEELYGAYASYNRLIKLALENGFQAEDMEGVIHSPTRRSPVPDVFEKAFKGKGSLNL